MALDDHGFILFEPDSFVDFTREPAGDVKTFQKIKFTPDVGVGFAPCPPEFTDYNSIVSGSFGPDVPAIALIDTFYRTDFVFININSLFKFNLTNGINYKCYTEGSTTQPSFTNYTNGIKCWSPTDWGGSILAPPTLAVAAEDVPPYLCPYNYKLNGLAIGWCGGHRMDVPCNETGEWVFLFYRLPGPS